MILPYYKNLHVYIHVCDGCIFNKLQELNSNAKIIL